MTSTNGSNHTTPSDPTPNGGVATRTRSSGSSFGTVSNFNRMTTTFPGAPASAPTNWKQQPDGNWWSWDGSTWHLQPQGPPPAPPVAGARRFSSDGALNKAGLLGLVALVVGAVAYLANAPVGLAWAGLVVGFGVGIWCALSPRRAPVLAPVFAVVEGFVLGVISRFYADQGAHVVTLAIAGTVAIVVGVWAVYRTGLVKVGPRFVMVTVVAGLGLLTVMVVSILTGWGASGTAGWLIFGVLYLILAVLNLFVDFSFVDRAEAAGLDADAEWFSAFMILQSSMMVYLALLRIFGGRA